MNDPLQTILNQAYQASTLVRGNIEDAFAAFAAQAKADPGFIDKATARLADIDDKVRKRCVISAAYADFLKDALARPRD